MVLSAASKNESTSGEMVNLLSLHGFKELFFHLNLLWSAPIQIIICMILLWKNLGLASLAGLITMLTILPITAYISYKSKLLHENRCELQDSRIEMTNEALSSIKILKFYAWEIPFGQNITKKKSDEMGIYLKISVLNALAHFFAISIPFLVAAVSFATFLINKNNVLDPNTAFVSISLFNILKSPLSNTPIMLSGLIQVKENYSLNFSIIFSLFKVNVTLQRLRTFLLREEIDEKSITHLKDEGK
jgi:hypothetical protein